MASQRKQVSATRSDRTENNRQEAGKKFESSTSKVFCEENIDFIDKELRKLNKFCLKSGYSVAQIVKFARPFTQTSTAVKRRKWKKIGLIGVLMIVVAVAGFQMQSSCRIASALAKTAMIKVRISQFSIFFLFFSALLILTFFFSLLCIINTRN